MSRNGTLYLTQNMAEPVVLDQLRGITVIFSSKCPDKETDNEDAAAVLVSTESSGVLVVADGMGGGAAGEQASKLAVTAIKKEVISHANNDLVLRAAILNGIESANEKIRALGIGAATTLAVVEIQEGVIRPYHVGDSSILVVGQRGKIKLQTVAHAPVSQAVEAGVLDDDDAMHHEDRHLVSNVVGAEDMRIEIGPTLTLSRFDTLLIATDGLFDNLAVDEIVENIRKGPLQQGVQRIVREVHQRMDDSSGNLPCKPDDLTVIAYRRGEN